MKKFNMILVLAMIGLVIGLTGCPAPVGGGGPSTIQINATNQVRSLSTSRDIAGTTDARMYTDSLDNVGQQLSTQALYSGTEAGVYTPTKFAISFAELDLEAT